MIVNFSLPNLANWQVAIHQFNGDIILKHLLHRLPTLSQPTLQFDPSTELGAIFSQGECLGEFSLAH
ncbi:MULTISPECIES: hypothetical protein [Salinivibrio]|uniref:hypothetical protein n=1 Tax=Salinivibrio TaxID=51366 RepID=UPI0006147FD0|nr:MULTISPECIES: hypothetical protein [Salinivibrio]KKA46185.1 hypothetical protein WN56_03565 [Salinivibrio sp. KP-1]ODP99647.1 hypothetical protein BGK46_10550 [Salinivibrio sp. DV]OOE64050.1 hypothetical protein BZG14_07980 [Salinivibrio sp. IB282]OOE67185.1 hypothetical protein BZG20_07020 [Salinivibrio sp. IB868]OOE77264.1 hypothetical protein BZG22_02025 [Salinivibrio sp. IB870]